MSKVISAAILIMALFSSGLAFVSFSQNAAVSRFPLTPGRDLGDFEITHGLRGSLERTTQFEVVPGEEFTFDMRLWNPDPIPVTSEIIIRVEPPNDGSMIFFRETIALEQHEQTSTSFSQFIPEDLLVFGRYTAKLLIDDRVADFFQFDVNSRGEIVVRWDDGVLTNAWAFLELCNAWAIRGCFPAGAILDSVGVYILSEGDPFWPWPDDIHQDVLIQVFDNDGPGNMPGTLLYSDVTRVTPGTSEAVVFPGIPISSAFYVANDQLTNFPDCEGQGVDEQVNHPDQMFTRIDNVWENAGGEYGGDFMIWAVGHVGSQRVILGNLPME
jgi:hypothetical protein